LWDTDKTNKMMAESHTYHIDLNWTWKTKNAYNFTS